MVNQIPGSIFKQIKSTNKLLKKSSLWFAYYKFVESTLYNILIRIHKFWKSNRYKKRVTLSIIDSAKRFDIPIMRTNNINDVKTLIKIDEFKPSIIISMMNQIIKNKTFNMLGKIFINSHGSYLPQYRGPAQYIFYIINSDNKFGITLHFMDGGIDNGDIILQKYFDFNPTISAYRLHYQMACKYAYMFNIFLDDYVNYKQISTIKQDERKATYTRLPNDDDIKYFKNNGNKLITLNDFINCV